MPGRYTVLDNKQDTSHHSWSSSLCKGKKQLLQTKNPIIGIHLKLLFNLLQIKQNRMYSIGTKEH